MAAKFTRLTHKIAIQLHLVAESYTICSSRSRRPVRKLSFLTSTPSGDEWSASRPGRFTVGDRDHGTHWLGSWMGSRADLDEMVMKLTNPCPCWESKAGRPACRPSQYLQLHLSLSSCYFLCFL
jgi:hypothetical protein